MFQVKYGAVLGFIKPSLEIVTGHIQKGAFLGQSQRRIWPGASEPRNFARRQCKLQWL